MPPDTAATPLCSCGSSPAFSLRRRCRSPVRRRWSPACRGSMALCPSTWRPGTWAWATRRGAPSYSTTSWSRSGAPARTPCSCGTRAGPGARPSAPSPSRLAPSSLSRDGTTARCRSWSRNPYSLTQVASIIFVDSPVGTGFSYARDPKGYNVGDISASLQVLTFLRKWFDDHPRYLSNPFYLGGDSYAGKMTPLIAQHVSEGIEEMQYPLINLKGYLVGNPLTGDKIDDNSRIPYCHSFGIISDQIYEAALINCRGDYVNPTNKLCANVGQTINDLMSEVDNEGILDPVCPSASPKPRRDALRRKSLAEEHYELSDGPPYGCIKYRYHPSYIWANDNATRAALGIKEGTVKEWIRCKPKGELPYTFDLPSSIGYHFKLTTRGYRALVYSGDHDLTVPFSGTHAWIRSFNFSIAEDWRAWHLDGQAAGSI
ncbi:hypothetical protein SETIT_9G106700v2 [Setaria italica]|uniref:Serine carboxypeptidase-like 19 n=1 Tax=Setaria italica TaxID=4555 RepID=A0A368SFC5_SETIT|nr:hypothetical protein SETIT_9G106700v2 [Setaria italica]